MTLLHIYLIFLSFLISLNLLGDFRSVLYCMIISGLGKLAGILARESAMWMVGDFTVRVTSLALSRSLDSQPN